MLAPPSGARTPEAWDDSHFMTVQVVAQVRALLERFQMQIAQQIQQVAAQQQQQQVVNQMLLQQVLAQQREQCALLQQRACAESGDNVHAQAQRPTACPMPWPLPPQRPVAAHQQPMLQLPPVLQSMPTPKPLQPGRQLPKGPPQHMPQEPPQELPQEEQRSPPPADADQVVQAAKDVVSTPKAASDADTVSSPTAEKTSRSPATALPEEANASPSSAFSQREAEEPELATPTPSLVAEESTAAGTAEISVGDSEEPPPPSPSREEALSLAREEVAENVETASKASGRGRHVRLGGRGSNSQLNWRPVIRSSMGKMGKTGPRNSQEEETSEMEKPRRIVYAKKDKSKYEWRPTRRDHSASFARP